MIGKTKLVLGLLVSVSAISFVWAENTVIGTYKSESASSVTNGSENGINNVIEGSKGIGSDKTDIPTVIGSQTTDISGNSGVKESRIEGTAIANRSGESIEGGDPQLEKKIADILNKNPEIIVEALQKFTERQERAQQEKMEASLMKYQSEISKESNAALLGKKDAEVKLVVFLDPNCPHCRPFAQALNKARENFPNVAILVRHWAILGKDSEEVVRGLWAIRQQGQDRFVAATKAIASSEERFTFPKLLAWVEDHKLNVAKFKEDSQSNSTKEVVEATSKLAKDIGLQGTPTSVLIDKNGIRLVMPTDEKSLESILKGATAKTDESIKGSAAKAA
jgi:protein-disulfide isomerase